MGITLEQLLDSRDKRAERQRELQKQFPGSALVCLTVQLPGSEKRNRTSLLIGGAGLPALLNKFGSVLKHVQVQDLETGYEAYLMVSLPASLVKRMTVELEEKHPLGRLMDMDVIGPDGPVSRESAGFGPRKCLLCDNEVRYCMRAHTHTQAELLCKIEQMVDGYV